MLQLNFAKDVGKTGPLILQSKVLTVWPTLRPLTNSTDNKRGLLKPAVNGTLNILDFVSKHVPQVKRIIFTSSFVAMIDIAKGRWPGHVYSEEDWNPATYEVVAAKDAPGALVYATAKTVAERAAWTSSRPRTLTLILQDSASNEIRSQHQRDCQSGQFELLFVC